MRRFIWAASFCFALALLAPVLGEDREKRFKSAITPEAVRPHVMHLASEEFNGRSGEDAVAASNYIRDHFRKLGLKPLFEDGYFQNIPGPKQPDGSPTLYGRNVGAWLPGSDETLQNEFVIVSAHYDHLGSRGGKVFRGADDNASGTSMLLEVARLYASLRERPKRSLVFIGFDLEEHLLWGSRWFVAHPPWPIERVKLFTTADMIGRSLGNLNLKTAFVMGAEHGAGLSSVLDEVGEPETLRIARIGIDLVGTRSDYGPFRDQKIPFLFFSSGEHPDYHTPNDLPERIDYEQVADVSGLVYEVTRHVANSQQVPTWTDDIQPRMEEVTSMNRICKSLLAQEATKPLTDIQRFIVKQAETTTNNIMARGVVTVAERKALIHTAQILLLSVF
jgi:Zn-dependent M28 family amino/carboxypeptidase